MRRYTCMHPQPTGHNLIADVITFRLRHVLNLHDETDHFLKENYPTLKEFENFLNLSSEAVKTFHKINGELKKPMFKRCDREQFIILHRWTEKYQVEGRIDWGHFNAENFNVNDFCERAPKEDLFEILKELGIYNQKVINTLDAKSIQSPAHFIQKPMSWYAKLCEEEQGTEGNIHQSKNLLLSGIDRTAIQKFKEWYLFHSIGYLPSDWIVSFRNDDVHPNERDLRKVLRVIGVNADAIDALKMNDIKDIPTLNRMSKNWRTESTESSESSEIRIDPHSTAAIGMRRSRSNEWKDMGLTRNDASAIISFRHWHKFYVAGKSNVKGWTKEFNSAQYNNFLQRFEPGDNFRIPIWKKDSLKFSQERHDYYDMLQEAAESGQVTDKQRYHLRKYYKEKKRENVSNRGDYFSP